MICFASEATPSAEDMSTDEDEDAFPMLDCVCVDPSFTPLTDKAGKSKEKISTYTESQ